MDATRDISSGGIDRSEPLDQDGYRSNTLHSKLVKKEQSGKQNGSYVSPSDGIMSPASAKLNAFKEKRFAKNTKPRSLFAKLDSTENQSKDSNKTQ